jgi:hypothetical protein
MSRSPVNLGFRLLLEMAGLVAFFSWGRTLAPGWVGTVSGLSLATSAAAVWGVFRVPNDGGPPRVEVPGQIRLLLEAVWFGSAVWMTSRNGPGGFALPFGVALGLHYLASWDRVLLLATGSPLPAPGAPTTTKS